MRFETVADFALGPLDVPARVLDFAATLLIDGLGVAAGAAPLRAAVIARNHAVRFLGAGSVGDRATVLSDGHSASIPGAAFAVATQIDNLDAHDGYNPTKGQIRCAVVPALCAFAEGKQGLSACDALVAMAMSYELAARAAVALHGTVSDYYTSGAWNALGVAALGCRLRTAETGQLRHALGIAECNGAHSQMMREIATPTMLHDGSGMGAMVGAMASRMSEDGFKGAPAITVEDPGTAAIRDDLGQDWTVDRNSIKPYPTCRWAHAPSDALGRTMAEHRIGTEAVEAIEVRIFRASAVLFPGIPHTTSQAQYSLRFAFATQLVRGRVGPAEITGAARRDPLIEASPPNIELAEDARPSGRIRVGRWCDLSLRLRDGRVLNSGEVNASGGPEAPMARSEMETRFRVLAANRPESRLAAVRAMRERMTDRAMPFADMLSPLHPAPETAHV